MPNPYGRQTNYTFELGERICELVATSKIGTTKLCDMYDWMPSEDTLYKWRNKYKEFNDIYLQAKSKQAELMIEEIIEIADNGVNDIFIDKEKNKRIDPGAIALRKLKIDTRKWYAAMLAPKIYGDKKEDDDNKNELKNELKILREEVQKCMRNLP